MLNEYFKDVPPIKYEGKESKNPLAFKFYNAEEKIGDKTMKDHLRFAVAYWHTMTGTGSDPFGVGTMIRPWTKCRPRWKKREGVSMCVSSLFRNSGYLFTVFMTGM